MNKSFGKIQANLTTISQFYNPQEFVGRKWLVEEVVKFRESQTGRHLIIVSEPGIGKSYFMAHLAIELNCPLHFIRVDSVNSITGLDPRSFLTNIGIQLYQKYGSEIFPKPAQNKTSVTVGWAQSGSKTIGRTIEELHTLPFLPPTVSSTEVKVGVATENSYIIGENIKKLVDISKALPIVTLLHILIFDPVKQIQSLYPKEKVVILIDALDESLEQTGPQIVDIIPKVMDAQFPPNLRLIMTSRPGKHLIEAGFRLEDQLHIQDKDKAFWHKNQQDVAKYIQNKLQKLNFSQTKASWNSSQLNQFVTEIQEKSEGNFLYLYHYFLALEDTISKQRIDFKQNDIPKGLHQIYRYFAVAKIKKNVLGSIYFQFKGSLNWQTLKGFDGVSEVTINKEEVVLTVTNSGKVVEQLYQTARENNIQIDNLIITGTELGSWEQKYIPILRALAICYAPLTVKQLALFTKVEEVYIKTMITQLDQFLRESTVQTETYYQIYHKSFSEYLLDENLNQDFILRPIDGHIDVAKFYLEAYGQDWASCDLYGLLYLPKHLLNAKETESLKSLLCNFSWLENKLKVTNINMLINDYIIDDPAINLIQKALQLSKHILVNQPDQLANQLKGRLLPLIALPSIPNLLSSLTFPSWHLDSPLFDVANSNLVQTLRDHSRRVREIAVTTDERKAISCSEDGTLQVWDLEAGEKIRTLVVRIDIEWREMFPFYAVVVIPNTTKIISASEFGSVYIWDIETGQRQTLSSYSMNTVYSIAVTQDGQKAICGARDGTIKVWDLETYEEIRTIKGHSEFVTSLAITTDGQKIISASWDGTLKVWDIETGKQILTLQKKGQSSPMPFLCVAVIPNTQQVISSAVDGTLTVWDLNTSEEIRTLIPERMGPVASFIVVPDKQQVVSGDTFGLVTIWDLETGKKIDTIIANYTEITSVALMLNKQQFLIGSADSIKIYNLKSKKERYSRKGHFNSGSQARGQIRSLALIASGQKFISASTDGTLKVWDMETRQEIYTLMGHKASVQSVVVSSNGQQAISGSLDHTLKVWNLETGEEVRTLTGHSNSIIDVALLSNKQQIMSASKDGTLKIWDIETGEEVRTISVYSNVKNGRSNNIINKIALSSSDKQQVILASENSTLQVWDIKTGKQTHILRNQSYEPFPCVAIIPDKQEFISSEDNGSLKIWDIETGKQIRTINKHSTGIQSITFMSDKQTVITTSWDGVLKVWNIETNLDVASYIADNPLYTAIVTLNEQYIITGGASGLLHFLKLDGSI